MDNKQKIEKIIGYEKANKSKVIQLMELGGILHVEYGIYKSIYLEFPDGSKFWRLRKGVENQVKCMCQITLHGKHGYSLKLKQP